LARACTGSKIKSGAGFDPGSRAFTRASRSARFAGSGRGVVTNCRPGCGAAGKPHLSFMTATTPRENDKFSTIRCIHPHRAAARVVTAKEQAQLVARYAAASRRPEEQHSVALSLAVAGNDDVAAARMTAHPCRYPAD
jgi:hypothetical protein